MKAIFLALILNTSIASLPSVESLFRHGANADIKMNTVRVDFEVQEIDLSEDELLDSSSAKKEYITMYFVKDQYDKIGLIQLSSDRVITEKSSLTHVFTHRKFIDLLTSKKNPELKKDLLYATLSSIVLNNSEIFSHVLKRTDGLYKSNNESLNTDKIKVLKRYKYYLSQIKENPELEGTRASPLKPGNEQDQDKINKTMNSPMYLANENLKLKRKGNEFLLNLTLENYVFNFTNDKHQFLDYKFTQGNETLAMYFQKFILFNGTHELPNKIVYKIEPGKSYLISFSKLSHFNVTRKFFAKKKKTSESLIKSGSSNEVEFLY